MSGEETSSAEDGKAASELTVLTPDQQFVHLHVHSEYSLADASLTIDDMVAKAAQMGHKAIALTDHANMFAAVEFYSKAKAKGLKPIIGSEIYFSGFPLTLELAAELGESLPDAGAFHLVLLAKSLEGYHQLIKVVSSGYLQGLGVVPVVPHQELVKLAKGELIALTACLRGELGFLLRKFREVNGDCPLLEDSFANFLAEEQPNKNIEAIRKAFIGFKAGMEEVFGADSIYVELIDNNLPGQRPLLNDLAVIARVFNWPLVATADAHYLDPSAAEAHTILLAIKNDLTRAKIRDRLQDTRFHQLNGQEFLDIYGAWPDAIANTLKIADRCKVEMRFGEYVLPKFDLGTGESTDDGLRRLSREGLKVRFAKIATNEGVAEIDQDRRKIYEDRLEAELEIIIKMGFPGYFLIVQDFINWAKDHGIPVGPGRGSGAGSLVAFALRITDIDPMLYNLVFERFLNPERISMPDFDVDFCQWRRDEVIEYVTRRYGADQVAQITTFGKMQAKAAIRDVGRALNMKNGHIDRIARLVPNELKITLAQAIEKEPKLREEMENDPDTKELMRLAQEVEGLSRHTSVHAAGVVISDGPMVNFVPVYTTPEGGLITQYEMVNAEKVGMIKFDFLGLKTLTVIEKAVEIIRGSVEKDFDLTAISLEHPDVYKMLGTGQTVGVFQMEGNGMQNLLQKLQPSTFEDIIAVVALFRPGPLGSGMVDDFIERKHGRAVIEYPLPQLEPILKETYGIILYQEQVMKIAVVLANYTLGEADLLRKAMGKKNAEVMAKQKKRFVDGAIANAIEEQVASDLFDLMAKFAEYGFNKSHSAAYGLIAYQTAFLKVCYPAEFMAAIMTCDTDNTDKIVRYVAESRRMGIRIAAPDVNLSQLEFCIPEPMVIQFGLAAIKGIGAQSLKPLLTERDLRGKYLSFADLAKRVDLPTVGKKTLELLVQAGACSGFKVPRKTAFSQLGELVKLSQRLHESKSGGQIGLFDEVENEDGEELELPWEKAAQGAEICQFDEEDLLRERKLLGTFLAGHPLDAYVDDAKSFANMTLTQMMHLKIPSQANADPTVKRRPKGVDAKIVAWFLGARIRVKDDGKRQAYLQFEDRKTPVEAIMFEKEIPEGDEFPEVDTPIMIYGEVRPGFDGGANRLRVERIVPLEDVRRGFIKSATLKVAMSKKTDALPTQEDQERINKALKLIRPESENGGIPVALSLKYLDAEVQITPAPEFRVSISDEVIGALHILRGLGISISYHRQ